MALLIIGLILFLGPHAFSIARGPRAALIARFGENGFKIGYSVLSVAGLILAVIGFGAYRASGYIQVWDPPVFTRHLALLLMLLAFIVFASMNLPSHIRARAKHPMLLGVKIWATAHLLANGDLGSILLFGSFLAWAVAARISAKRRPLTPAQIERQTAPAGWRNDAIAVVAGTVAWFVFARFLHQWLIGVYAWPGIA